MQLNEIIEHWKCISPVIREPNNVEEYKQLASFLDKLLDIVGENESHELIGLVDVISFMISKYDDSHPEGV